MAVLACRGDNGAVGDRSRGSGRQSVLCKGGSDQGCRPQAPKRGTCCLFVMDVCLLCLLCLMCYNSLKQSQGPAPLDDKGGPAISAHVQCDRRVSPLLVVPGVLQQSRAVTGTCARTQAQPTMAAPLQHTHSLARAPTPTHCAAPVAASSLPKSG